MPDANSLTEAPAVSSTPRSTANGRVGIAAALWQALVLTAIMLASLGGYLLVLKWRGPDARLTTHTTWDDVIPFRPGWVWVYLIPYVIGPIVIGSFRRETFRWYVQRGLVLVVVTLLIFIAVPTKTAPRPRLDLGDGPTAQLYQLIVEVDEPPANAAPSLHVSLTFLLALAFMRDFPRWAWLAAIAISLVWLATLFTRQHHLLDVATGILLAWIVVLFWARSKLG
jgi:membrane-associated phospholipid phosphatase